MLCQLDAVDESPVVQPWEPQPGEPSRQFATFYAYRDLHPLERSLAEVGHRLGMSTTYVERLSSDYGWVRRVAAYDREQDRTRRALQERQIEAMHAAHAEIAASVLRKVAERIETIDANSLRPRDLIRWLDVACGVEREAREMAAARLVCDGGVDSMSAAAVRAKLRAEGILRDLGIA